MAKLTIPYLLRQIRSNQIDADVYARCQEAERLSRQRDFTNAVTLAQAAADIATQSGTPLDIGVAFLYLAIIRHATPNKMAQDQAPDDANTALEWLKRDNHYATIAHLIRAGILADHQRTRAAATHYRHAIDIMSALAAEWHRRDRTDEERYYQQLRGEVINVMQRLRFERTESDQDENESPLTTSPLPTVGDKLPNVPPPIRLPIPTKLVWSKKSDNLKFDSDRDEVSEVTIDGQRYLVEPIESASHAHRLELKSGQPYIAIPIEDKEQSGDTPNRYVLIRQQDYLDQPQQIIVVFESNGARAWVDQSESTAPFTHVHIIGQKRDWNIPDSKELIILGVVEAVLRRAPSDDAGAMPEPVTSAPTPPSDITSAAASMDEIDAASAPSSPTPATAAPHKLGPQPVAKTPDYDDNLLRCIDDFNSARQKHPQVNKDLLVLQTKFHNYVRQQYGLEIISIKLGETPFDPTLGHMAIDTTNDPTMLDGVIVHVVSDGYTHQGTVVREAQVIVNQVKPS